MSFDFFNYSSEVEEQQDTIQEDYECLKISSKHCLIVNVKNELFEINDQMIDDIDELVIRIVDDELLKFCITNSNVQSILWAEQLHKLVKVKSITIERNQQFLTCTQSIRQALEMIKKIVNLKQLQSIEFKFPIKEKFSSEWRIESDQNLSWDEEDDEETNDELKTDSYEDKIFKQSETKKTKEQEYAQKMQILKKNKYDLLLDVLILIEKNCFQLNNFSLIMNSWFSVDQNSDDKDYFAQFFNVLCRIIENNSNNLESLHLNAFQWGFYNKNLNSQQFDLIMKSIHKINPSNLKELSLDFGRWGCEEYQNYKIFDDKNVLLFASVLQNMKNLSFLKFNLRSWAYCNPSISDLSVIPLFSAISQMSQLITLDIEVSRWKYENYAITDLSLKQIAYTIFSLRQLENLTLSLKTWQCDYDDEETQIRQLQQIRFLQILQAPLFLNKLMKVQINIEDQFDDNFTEQMDHAKEIRKKLNLENKNRFYMFKAIQKQYCEQFRKEIIWEIVKSCSNYDYENLEEQFKKSLCLESINIQIS